MASVLNALLDRFLGSEESENTDESEIEESVISPSVLNFMGISDEAAIEHLAQASTRAMAVSEIREYVVALSDPATCVRLSGVNRDFSEATEPLRRVIGWLYTHGGDGPEFGEFRFWARPSVVGHRDHCLWRIVMGKAGAGAFELRNAHGTLQFTGGDEILLTVAWPRMNVLTRLWNDLGFCVDIARFKVGELRDVIESTPWERPLVEGDRRVRHFSTPASFPGDFEDGVVHHPIDSGNAMEEWLQSLVPGQARRMEIFRDHTGIWQIRRRAIGLWQDGPPLRTDFNYFGVVEIMDATAFIWVQGLRNVAHRDARAGFRGHRGWCYMRARGNISTLGDLQSVLSEEGNGLLDFSRRRHTDAAIPICHRSTSQRI